MQYIKQTNFKESYKPRRLRQINGERLYIWFQTYKIRPQMHLQELWTHFAIAITVKLIMMAEIFEAWCCKKVLKI